MTHFISSCIVADSVHLEDEAVTAASSTEYDQQIFEFFYNRISSQQQEEQINNVEADRLGGLDLSAKEFRRLYQL